MIFLGVERLYLEVEQCAQMVAKQIKATGLCLVLNVGLERQKTPLANMSAQN